MINLSRFTGMEMCVINTDKKVDLSFVTAKFRILWTNKVRYVWSLDCGDLFVMVGILIAFTVNLLSLSIEASWTLYSFVFIVSSSPPTLVMVTDVSFLFRPRVSVVSICAPESSRTFPSLKRLFALMIFAERTDKIASFVLIAIATPILIALVLWSSWWWLCGHCVLFSIFVHRRIRLQLSLLWSLLALFRQLKHTWLALAILIRPSMLRAANFWRWSDQCVEVLHNQHLYQGSWSLSSP